MNRRWLSTISKLLFASGALLIVVAVAAPVAASPLLWLGLALWPLSALAKFTWHYLRRDPMPSHGGAPILPQERPISYHIGFVAVVAMFSLITYIAVRAYVAA
jgi:hypothetical protein